MSGDMKKSKAQRVLVLSVIVMIAVAVYILFFRTEIAKEKAITKINEEYFDLSLNLEEKTADVDGKTVELTELFALSETELDDMIEDGSLERFLGEQLVGDVTYEDGMATVSNPYSTKSLILKTEDPSVFDEYEDIVSVNQISKYIYVVDYQTASDTKEGYQDLQEDSSVSTVLTDEKVWADDDGLTTRAMNPNYISWGVTSMGLGHYKTKLSYAGNDREVKVAIVDTGINWNHEAFTSKKNADRISFEGSYDYVNSDSDARDDEGHGTAVAGVVAQSTPDNVKLIPVKVLNSMGSGYTSDILEGAKAVSQYADIINMSLGGYYTESMMEMADEVYEEIYHSGTIVVCSAGNSSRSDGTHYPSDCKYNLSISAIDQNGKFTSFSNYGETTDFAAPGVEIISALYSDNSSYTAKNGTSFSSPFAAAAIANVKAEYGYTERSKTIDVIKANAEDLGDPGKDIYYGYGSINFDSAMFQSPVIASLKEIETDDVQESAIEVKAVSAKKMVSYALTQTNAEPTKWTTLSTQTDTLEMTCTVKKNGIYYLWLKDEKGNTACESVTVKNLKNGNFVEVENHTNGKAEVTIGDIKDTSGDFTTVTEKGRMTISCDSPVVVTLVETVGTKTTSTKLEYTRINKDGDYEYDFAVSDVKFLIDL